ncbi:aminotransferase class I/II-fold pyridoxal phosphate-dependent enzyme [Arthrospiribacter ruber]|uniref:Aminotransferase class I/II-fold pyridoxal phosphate-dependent enzyme n=1 Tax=Arthrospiribacter ruber TaxID=2487934 RepID=A0A951J037_9BACT|nr:aminotransferase class I/II-fold pyridoxal phosphate-dependent enzyme [Arthrospiribacter ruber]MBW3470173.1 aminotransferase class I/II-fold pyridoxal phosphate-dependent enzyme [Arthrospiribacter ruber]
MQENTHLSDRGQMAAAKPLRMDMDIYMEAMSNRYHVSSKPDGTFPMTVAENHLCWEMLRNKMQEISRNQEIPEWVASYGDPAGVLSFREAAADFLSGFLVKKTVDPNTIACSVGATSVIEMTTFLLAESGDTAVIPAPSYPVYSADIGVMAGLKRYDLQTHHEVADLADGIPIQLSHLEEAKKEIEENGSRFRILILTSPDNPTGGIYSENQLQEIADWCEKEKIHLIVNEIYGIARVNVQHPEIKKDYKNPIEFKSFGQIMNERKSPFLHLWYSFSKDFGISGFRVGLLHTFNEALITGYRNIGLTHAISNHTQWLMQEVLKDKDFVKEYFEKFQEALTLSYIKVNQTLKKLHIPFNPSYGSLFVWMDLSGLLENQTDEDQHQLWLEIFRQTGILLTPGNGFGHSKKGMFRIVITSVTHEELEVAMERFEKFYIEKNNETN